MEHVVDSDTSRFGASYHDMLGFCDTAAPCNVQLQRAGRGSRVAACANSRVFVPGSLR